MAAVSNATNWNIIWCSIVDGKWDRSSWCQNLDVWSVFCGAAVEIVKPRPWRAAHSLQDRGGGLTGSLWVPVPIQRACVHELFASCPSYYIAVPQSDTKQRILCMCCHLPYGSYRKCQSLRHLCWNPEYGGSSFPRNVSIHLQFRSITAQNNIDLFAVGTSYRRPPLISTSPSENQVQASSGANPTSVPVGVGGFSPLIKEPVREAAQTRRNKCGVRECMEFISMTPVYLHSHLLPLLFRCSLCCVMSEWACACLSACCVFCNSGNCGPIVESIFVQQRDLWSHSCKNSLRLLLEDFIAQQ
jgi:hypothetical protein